MRIIPPGTQAFIQYGDDIEYFKVDIHGHYEMTGQPYYGWFHWVDCYWQKIVRFNREGLKLIEELESEE